MNQDNSNKTENGNKHVESYFAEKFHTTSKRLNKDSREEIYTVAIKPKWTIQLKLMSIISLLFTILATVIISLATYYFKKTMKFVLRKTTSKSLS